MKYRNYYAGRLTTLIMVVLTTACSSSPVEPPPNTGKYSAELNPNPQYFMTVKGFISPAIAQNHKLTFIADYYTNNPACSYVVNSFEGVSSSRKDAYTVTLSSEQFGDYEVKVPLDAFKGGYCDWEISDISYHLTGNKLYFISTMAVFDKNSKNKSYNVHDRIKCNLNDCTSLVLPYLDTEYFLSTTVNYIFKLDIYKE